MVWNERKKDKYWWSDVKQFNVVNLIVCLMISILPRLPYFLPNDRVDRYWDLYYLYLDRTAQLSTLLHIEQRNRLLGYSSINLVKSSFIALLRLRTYWCIHVCIYALFSVHFETLVIMNSFWPYARLKKSVVNKKKIWKKITDSDKK